MSWLEGIRAAGTSAPGFTPRVYREGGRFYTETLSGGALTDAYEIPGQVVGYAGADEGPWFPGKRGQLYDTEGRWTGDFELLDPNASDLGEKLALGTILAIATAGAFQAFGGLTGGATAGTGQAGPVLSKAALDGTTAFGANSVPGAYSLGTAGVSAGAGAGAGGLGATINSALGAVKTALGVSSAVGGLTGASGTAATPTTSYVPFTTQPGGALADVNPLWLLAGAAAVVFVLLEG